MIFSKVLEFSLGNFLLLSSGVFVIYFLLQYLLDPLRSIPGPLLARFTRLWYFQQIYKGNFEQTNVELHKRYGPIVRIAPYEYSIDDFEAAKTIYGHGNAFLKAPWYWSWTTAADPTKASLFADLDPHHHSFQRRKFSFMYSMSSLVGYEPFVNNCTSLLCQRFEELAATGNVIDLYHWLQCYAFDVIGEITFANRFGCLDMGEDKEGIFEAIDIRINYAGMVGVFPWLHKWLVGLAPKDGGAAWLMKFTMRQVEEREKLLRDPKMSGREGPPDIMTKILNEHENDPEKMTKVDLFVMCQTNIGAGSDTTAITLASIMYNLIAHPQSWQTLRNELDTASKEGRISSPITFKEAQTLPYLQAVMKEGLRIHSATGFPMARLVPPQGTTIANHFIPGGSTVGINSWVAHFNPTIYGPDADKWRPERWLEFEEQGRNGEIEKYSLAFGMGSRTCIGKNISLLEISKLVPELVRRFEFVLEGEVRDVGVKSRNRWFVKQMNLLGRVRVRGGEKR